MSNVLNYQREPDHCRDEDRAKWHYSIIAVLKEGADFSGSRVLGDLSISDIALTSGTLTFHRASIGGIARLMVTLKRDPQGFGGSIDFSNATIGGLVISSGDRENRSEYTGPPRWDLAADIFLKESKINTLALHKRTRHPQLAE